ncbi:MAG: AmmeMemoRadiSam system radical SAM enzyme [Verrucomicrobiota bacterium]
MQNELKETVITRRTFIASSSAAAAFAGIRTSLAANTGLKEVEARFYEKKPGKTVKCLLCPWSCTVPEGHRGKCGVRENRGGRYYSLVYGRLVARNNDPIEKKPLFHVYPGSRTYSIATVGCNIHCKFCQNWEISQADPKKVSVPYMSPEKLVSTAKKNKGTKTIAYTYNEPTVFSEYILDCAKVASEHGLGNVMISNGFIAGKPLEEICARMTAIKIDLKAFSEEFYSNICSGKLKPVLNTLKRIADSNAWLEIVMLIIPSLNDDMDKIKEMSGWIVKELGNNVPLHFTRFHPQYKVRNLPPTPVKTLQEARGAAMKEGCNFVYTGNTPDVDSASTYCPECGEKIVRRYRMFLMNNSLKENKCHNCSANIPGIWT